MASSFLRMDVNSSQEVPIPAKMLCIKMGTGRSLAHYRRWLQIPKLHSAKPAEAGLAGPVKYKSMLLTLCSKTALRTLLYSKEDSSLFPFAELGKFLKRLGQESQTTELLEALRDQTSKLPYFLLRPLHVHYKSSVVAHMHPGLLGPFPTQGLQRSASYS